MRSFLCGLFVITCFALYINGQDIRPIRNSARVLPASQYLTRAIPTCTPADRGLWKCNNCDTTYQCTNENEPKVVKLATCADQFPGRPYCDNTETDVSKKCVANVDVCSDTTSEPFICPGRGLYPSLVSCRDYFTCPTKGDIGSQYACTPPTIFNYARRDCITNSLCYTVKADCANKNKVIQYKLNNTLYVECRTDLPPVLNDCGSHKAYIPTLMDCQFVCKAEGTFGDPSQEKGAQKIYYKCILNGRGGYNVTEHTCDVSGEVYDEDLKRCEAP